MKNFIKRKNFYLDESKIRKAKTILHTKTETETIHKALDLVVFEREILSSLDRVKAKGHIVHPHRSNA